MTANIGKLDLVIRAVLGIVLFFAPLMNVPAIWSNSMLAYASMGIGLVLIFTAAFRFCPLYRILGISTCKI